MEGESQLRRPRYHPTHLSSGGSEPPNGRDRRRGRQRLACHRDTRSNSAGQPDVVKVGNALVKVWEIGNDEKSWKNATTASYWPIRSDFVIGKSWNSVNLPTETISFRIWICANRSTDLNLEGRCFVAASVRQPPPIYPTAAFVFIALMMPTILVASSSLNREVGPSGLRFVNGCSKSILGSITPFCVK